jgi:hypothetical protein
MQRPGLLLSYRFQFAMYVAVQGTVEASHEVGHPTYLIVSDSLFCWFLNLPAKLPGTHPMGQTFHRPPYST